MTFNGLVRVNLIVRFIYINNREISTCTSTIVLNTIRTLEVISITIDGNAIRILSRWRHHFSFSLMGIRWCLWKLSSLGNSFFSQPYTTKRSKREDATCTPQPEKPYADLLLLNGKATPPESLTNCRFFPFSPLFFFLRWKDEGKMSLKLEEGNMSSDFEPKTINQKGNTLTIELRIRWPLPLAVGI